LSADFFHVNADELREDLTLQAISKYIRDGGHTLTNFGLPEPRTRSQETVDELERYAPRAREIAAQGVDMVSRMNGEQRGIYDCILRIVHERQQFDRVSRPLFVEGKPGHGKTFLMDAVGCTLRGENMIVLFVGTSALAATLYEGGRTAHNLFGIPVTEVCLFLHRSLLIIEPST
jgi:hypothetical protein